MDGSASSAPGFCKRHRFASGTAIAIVFGSLVGFGWFFARRHYTRFHNYPPITLWAWERPEDFRGLDPNRFAVAYLDQTILVSNHVEVVPRRQPLAVDPRAKVIAVVRIEAHPGTADLKDPSLPEKVAAIISESAAHRGVSAIQVDFDARESQRHFYESILKELRGRLPEKMPLSITALASWCAFDDWISDLPIDEAVPMFFRMGPEHPPSSSMGGSTRFASPYVVGLLVFRPTKHGPN